MPKVCKVESCSNPVFGGGYCKYHQNLREDKKPKKLKKLSERGRLAKEAKKDLIELDKIFYQKIWEEREHVCYESNEYLGDEPNIFYFHHVLEKSKYPQYRHCAWNIILVKAEIHTQIHSNIDKTPKVKVLTQQLKEEHG
jgi:hypothetical protein